MKALTISPDFRLPYEAQTRTFVVYGGKGKGKSNLGAVLCEEFAEAGLKFCVIDPLDVFWGLRHGKTKDEQGIDVVILGGTHADLPIEPGAGNIAADFVVDESASVIIVMRRGNGEMWTNGERIRFMRDFATRLFQRQGEHRQPLHLIVDEAGRFVPQMPAKNDLAIAECIGAIEQLVEWGRNFGIGVTLITQRSARMNKSVSELAECMVAFQTAGPRSIGAVVDWFGEHVPKERQKELVGILRKLPVGRALIVSPEFLDFEGEAQIRHRHTFDSSATPKAGERPHKPGARRAVDLEAYRVKLGETIAKAEAEDPRTLAKRIRDLEAQLKQRAAAATAVGDTKAAEQAVRAIEKTHALALAQLRKRIDKLTTELASFGGILEKAAESGRNMIKAFGRRLEDVTADPIWTGEARPVAPMTGEFVEQIRLFPSAEAKQLGEAIGKRIVDRVVNAPPVFHEAGRMTPEQIRDAGGMTARQIFDDHAGNGAGKPIEAIPSGARTVLNMLAQLEANGVASASPRRLAPLAGVKSGGSTWRGYLAKLRARALIEDVGGDLRLTDAGRALASDTPAWHSLDELHRYWLDRVGAASKILEPLLSREPSPRAWLADRAGVQLAGSTWRGYLATLRRYNLIVDDGENIGANFEVLFPPGLT